MKKFTFFVSLVILVLNSLLVNAQQASKQTVSILSANDITLTADLYLLDDADAPFIILFHQARYSRGEYIESAKKFNGLGYSCLAVDQRSGKEVNGVQNLAAKQAEEKGVGTNYEDALPDLEAAISFVKEKYAPKTLYLLGSSYSASLVIVLSTKIVGISGVLAFSPGEYFKIEGKQIKEFAHEALCPVFVTSAKNEITKWEGIYNALPNSLAYDFKPKGEGKHGSKTLWESTPENEEYWIAVREFLD